jgi:uncharacterized protein YbjQ (UPF0145 family)
MASAATAINVTRLRVSATRSPVDAPARAFPLVGGRSGSYEKKIEIGREEAMSDLRVETDELRADAVVGVAFDYEEMAEGCSG